MNCLLVAATVVEINPFLEKYRAGKLFSSAEIDILITSVGLTAATHSLTKQVYLKRPDFVIQAGIGGCFTKKIPLATVCAVKQESIADQGVNESGKFKDLFALGLVKSNQFPYSNSRLTNNNILLKKIKLKKVNGITVNEITTSKQRIHLYQKKYSAVIESLEGVALHYVCLSEKIPFLQLRSVSNYIGERDKKKWKIKESINNLNEELVKILEQL